MLLSLSALPRPALALDVIGNINANTTWKKSDSPVRLTGDVTVAGHVTLQIEAGTVIEAAANDMLGSGTDTNKVELIVKGSLQAVGTAADHIVIRGASRTPTGWYGMSFEPGAKESNLTFVDISDASMGVYARTTNPLTMQDISISGCGTGLRWQTSPGPTLTRALIRDSVTYGVLVSDDGTSGAKLTMSSSDVRGSGTAGVKLGDRITATVARSTFLNNYVGVDADAGSALTITNSLLVANLVAALQIKQSGSSVFSVVNNTLDRNDYGAVGMAAQGAGIKVLAVTDASKFIVRNNIVTNHLHFGVQVMGATSPSLDHNNVWGNGANYSSGLSAGPGSVSANPLFRSGGGTTTTIGSAFSHLGYPNNDSWTFTCTNPRALRMYAQFSSFATEAGRDVVSIVDGAGMVVQNFSGMLSAPTSMSVDGQALTLRFVSDGSVTYSGFEGRCMAVEAVTSNNYRLQSGSPVIDLGNNLDAPTVDLDGIMRPIDGDMDGMATVDIGAFEWHMNRSPSSKPGADKLVLVNKSVDFDGRGSVDPDGTITGYAWDFGDGSAPAMGPTASHTYTSVGMYTVKLTVTDDEGSTDSATMKVVVVDNLPPVAKPGPDQKIMPGMMVSLDGGGSFDPDGSIVSYDWDFGDATPKGSGRTVTHVYAAAGTFRATLTVTDNKGATGSAYATITVGDGGPDMASPTDGGGGTVDGGTMGDGGGGGPRDMAGGGSSDGGSDSPDLATPGTGPGPTRPGEVTGCSCDVGHAAGGAGLPGPLAVAMAGALVAWLRRRERRATSAARSHG